MCCYFVTDTLAPANDFVVAASSLFQALLVNKQFSKRCSAVILICPLYILEVYWLKLVVVCIHNMSWWSKLEAVPCCFKSLIQVLSHSACAGNFHPGGILSFLWTGAPVETVSSRPRSRKMYVAWYQNWNLVCLDDALLQTSMRHNGVYTVSYLVGLQTPAGGWVGPQIHGGPSRMEPVCLSRFSLQNEFQTHKVDFCPLRRRGIHQ